MEYTRKSRDLGELFVEVTGQTGTTERQTESGRTRQFATGGDGGLDRERELSEFVVGFSREDPLEDAIGITDGR